MSKSVRKILVSGSALLLLLSTGASLISSPINAKRIHHARTHRIYKHYEKHYRARKKTHYHRHHYYHPKKSRYAGIKISNKDSLSPSFFYNMNYKKNKHNRKVQNFVYSHKQAFHGFIDAMNRVTLNSYLARHNIYYRIGWIDATAGSDAHAVEPTHTDEYNLCTTGIHDFKNGLAYAKKYHAVHIWYDSIGYTKWCAYRNHKGKIIHTYREPVLD